MLSTFFHWLHLLGVVFWIGGVGYVVLVLLPSMPLIALRDRAKLMPRLLKRFLTVVWVSIALIASSGLYRVFFILGITAPEQFYYTWYGNLLAVKLATVIALIGVALLVTFRLYPRAVRHVQTHANEGPDSYKCPACATVAGSIRTHLETGLALGVVIIFMAAMLRGA